MTHIQSAAKLQDEHFDCAQYLAQLRKVVLVKSDLTRQHYQYMTNLKHTLPSTPSPLQISTCLQRNRTWGVYIANVGAVIFGQPMSGQPGCLEYKDMSDDEKTLMSTFASQQVKKRGTLPPDHPFFDALQRLLPDVLPACKLYAAQVEARDVENGDTAVYDQMANLGAILFD